MKVAHCACHCSRRLVSCATLSSPLARGVKAKDHGLIGAGEGPAWQNGSLYFTDGKRINRLDESGRTTVFRNAADAHAANGLMFDAQGRLVACESKARRVTRTERSPCWRSLSWTPFQFAQRSTIVRTGASVSPTRTTVRARHPRSRDVCRGVIGSMRQESIASRCPPSNVKRHPVSPRDGLLCLRQQQTTMARSQTAAL